MVRFAHMLVITLIILIALSACGAPATAPPSAATTAPAAPTGAPASRGTPAPLPPQPTSPPVPTKAATPYVTPTFSPILSFPLGATPVSTPAAVSTPTGGGQVPAGPTASGTATGVRSELKVEFVKPLSTAEEVDDISLVLRRIPGIFAVSGNEVGITIVYDAGLILPNQIRVRLASMGHEVKP